MAETPLKNSAEEPPDSWGPVRRRIRIIIFGTDTPAGKAFDVGLWLAIGASVVVVMLDSVEDFERDFGRILFGAEWFFTILFSFEYILRLATVRQPLRYALSFFGIVDLLSVVPTYLSFFFPGTHYLLIVRSLRLLRIFRVLKLSRFVDESQVLMTALRMSLPKISVFLLSILTIVCIMGALMYVVEGRESGFSSIPRGMYWAIVTLTTVGYGDIAPKTALGQVLASMLMIMGYGIIAVPTGIVSVELANAARTPVTGISCGSCGSDGHDLDAVHCKFCGESLSQDRNSVDSARARS